ncbi:neuroligin-4, Y-linked-like isoform X2 [Antedon mediterranea]|uniref:neuroligin-4, Y-linked-like isoform X2 n=1 Tax=Antedon mediterranea TaxID=105859 RepID=UPI003AF99A52
MWCCVIQCITVLIILTAVVSTRVVDCSDGYGVVNTTFGRLRGLRVKPALEDMSEIYQFLGIPYAAPPTGRRRFSAPESPVKWEQRDALNFGPACPQSFEITPGMTPRKKRQLENVRPFVKNISEDCLYLNVYTPSINPGVDKFPVMVFIHDGEFRSGSGSIYNGSILAGYAGVIVVTVNFRLGILGFLSSGTGAAKGNYGLQDQIAALQWIQDNISAFNGDKSRVTVVGAGSGAASSGILALSNRTSGLIHRVIAQGGSPLAPWVMSTEPSTYFDRLAERFGCQKKPQSDIIDELRNVPFEELLLAEKDIRAPLYFIAFGPVIDGDIITDVPANLIRNTVRKVSIMTGFTEGDAYELVELQTDENGAILAKDYDEILLGFVQNHYGSGINFRDIIKKAIHFEYTGWEDGTTAESTSYSENVLSFISDRQWVVPAIQTVKMFDEAGLVGYLYFFASRMRTSFARRWAGSIFLDELPFVLGAPLVPSGIGVYAYNYTRREAQISRSVMTHWTNFVKTGNPNMPKEQDIQNGDSRKKYGGNIAVNNNTYNEAMISRAMRKDSSFEDERLMTQVAAERLANHSRGNDVVSPTTKIRAEKNEYEMDV